MEPDNQAPNAQDLTPVNTMQGPEDIVSTLNQDIKTPLKRKVVLSESPTSDMNFSKIVHISYDELNKLHEDLANALRQVANLESRIRSLEAKAASQAQPTAQDPVLNRIVLPSQTSSSSSYAAVVASSTVNSSTPIPTNPNSVQAQGEDKAQATLKSIQAFVHENRKKKTRSNNKMTQLSSDDLESVTITMPRMPFSQVRATLRDLNVNASHIINMSFVSKFRLEMLVEKSHIQSILGNGYMKKLEPVRAMDHSSPLDPNASNELRLRFRQNFMKRVSRIVEENHIQAVRDFYRNLYHQLPPVECLISSSDELSETDTVIEECH
jgi:hypothetical protein